MMKRNALRQFLLNAFLSFDYIFGLFENLSAARSLEHFRTELTSFSQGGKVYLQFPFFLNIAFRLGINIAC